MSMGRIWTAMAALSVACGLCTGRMDAVAAAVMDGAAAAAELCLSMVGMLCLWSGILEVMSRAGLSAKLSRLLRPVLRWLYPDFAGDRAVMDALASNMSANLLGLGNAATPPGLEAARRMAQRTPGVANDSLCLLVVCSTASIQVIPTTVAALRAAAGSETPFDILPCVWFASAIAFAVGIAAAKLFAWLGRGTPHPSRRCRDTFCPQGTRRICKAAKLLTAALSSRRRQGKLSAGGLLPQKKGTGTPR